MSVLFDVFALIVGGGVVLYLIGWTGFVLWHFVKGKPVERIGCLAASADFFLGLTLVWGLLVLTAGRPPDWFTGGILAVAALMAVIGWLAKRHQSRS